MKKIFLVILFMCFFGTANGASITDYGAIGDGITNNDYVFDEIENQEEFNQFYVPEGIYCLSDWYDLTKRYDGPGILKIGNHKQANHIGQITKHPEIGSLSDKEAHFDGDMSNVLRAEKFTISVGEDNPVPNVNGKYLYYYETSPHFASFEIGSGVGGYNGLHSNGRTGITWNRVMMRHRGLGDAAVWNAYVECGDPSHDTTSDIHFGYNAGVILNGDVKAIADYAYINPLEINLVDDGNKASGVGLVLNFHRTNSDTSKGNIWMGTRMQSKGSEYCDVAYSAVGKWFFGLDLTPIAFDEKKAAIVMNAGDKIYFNATGNGWKCVSTGNAYISYDSEFGSLFASTDLHISGKVVSNVGFSSCDYVFKEELMPLSKLGKYINEEGHLPNMTINKGGEIDYNIAIKELLIKAEEQAIYILQLHNWIFRLLFGEMFLFVLLMLVAIKKLYNK